jgi:hypothetical protein
MISVDTQIMIEFQHRSIIRNARYSNGPFRVYYKEIVLYMFFIVFVEPLRFLRPFFLEYYNEFSDVFHCRITVQAKI